MELIDPTITVRENGVLDWVGPTAMPSPLGTELNVSTTVLGSSRTEVVACAPCESVAINRSSRYDGYSWSGAVKLPLLTPLKVCSTWVWQLEGQWNITRSQRSADAGRVPCSASLACPEKETTVPTDQVVALVGESMTGVGGVLTGVATLMVVGELIEVAPRGSVTRRRAW